MNPSEAARTVSDEHDLTGRTHALLWENHDLKGRVAELEYELAEDKAELRRHHEDFRMVQGLLSDAEAVIRDNPASTHDGELVLEDLWSIVRSIRSIVG